MASSVRRDEKHIVAVVLGGTSNAARDARMRQLIEDYISLASTKRTVPVIVEANGQRSADGHWELYLAAQRLQDDRWRYQSPSHIARLYADLGWKGTDAVPTQRQANFLISNLTNQPISVGGTLQTATTTQ